MPRLVRWHALHPDIELDIDSSLRVVDLQREGFHAALRVGGGPWRRLDCERLVESRRVVVCAPQRAARLAGAGVAALSAEPLLGDAGQWTRWFALAGGRLHAKPVADFNDAGLMLQAAEHDMGIAMVLELTAADALQSGSLRRLTRVALDEPGADSHWLVNPPELAEWPPLAAFRHWLRAELAQSERMLDGLPAPVELGLEARPAAPSTDSAAARPAGTSTAGRTGNRSRGRSG
jgi:LysR family glycine cleavage system transcriptional activator